MTDLQKGTFPDLQSAIDGVTNVMVETKEKLIADDSNPDKDLLCYIHCFRRAEEGRPGYELISSVICKHDASKFYKSAHASAFAFSADFLTMTVEAYTGKVENNPETGMEWEKGDLQFLAKSDPKKFREVGTEAVITTAYDRYGNLIQKIQPFYAEDKKVVWEKESLSTATFEEVTDRDNSFMKIMQDETMEQYLARTREGSPMAEMAFKVIPTTVRLVQTDIAAFEQLMENDLAIAVALSAIPDSERWRVLDEKLHDNDPAKSGFAVIDSRDQGTSSDD